MNREEATRLICEARIAHRITWVQLADAIGRSKVWTTAALLGQHPLSPEEADTITHILGLNQETAEALQQIPSRGELAIPPSDPTIYRFQELIQVYGPALKQLIHEEFGDGIMSAIDFEMSLDRKPDPAGDRVYITMSGKFLSYRKF